MRPVTKEIQSLIKKCSTVTAEIKFKIYKYIILYMHI